MDDYTLPLPLRQPLPDKWIPLEVVSIIKCLDEDGDPALTIRTSGGLCEWEIVGMLTCCNDNLRTEITQRLTDRYDPPEDPDAS